MKNVITSDDMVLALNDAPVDPRTGNKVVYSASWVATNNSMMGKVNEDWVRRELAWFNSGSDKLEDMEGPVPKLFQACAGSDPEQRVNSAYGHILFDSRATSSLYARILNTLIYEGLETRHAVAIISDRDVHKMAKLHGRNDFICTNALNIMVDADNHLHIIAQMRSMDAVFGYRADYSMWDSLMERLLSDLEGLRLAGLTSQYPVTRGDITFQVANLHVYPRHLELLETTADIIHDKFEAEARRIWMGRAGWALPGTAV